MNATTVSDEATAPKPPAAAQTNANITKSGTVPVAQPDSAPIENTSPSPGLNQLNINLFAAPSDGELNNGLQLGVEANIDDIELGDTLSDALGMLSELIEEETAAALTLQNLHAEASQANFPAPFPAPNCRFTNFDGEMINAG